MKNATTEMTTIMDRKGKLVQIRLTLTIYKNEPKAIPGPSPKD